MDKGCAGSLYSKLAALAARELGAQASDAGSVHDAPAIRRLVCLVRCRSIPGGGHACGTENGKAVEIVFLKNDAFVYNARGTLERQRTTRSNTRRWCAASRTR